MALLENKVRDNLVQLIQSEPGITPLDLQKRVSVGWRTVVYNLGLLERTTS